MHHITAAILLRHVTLWRVALRVELGVSLSVAWILPNLPTCAFLQLGVCVCIDCYSVTSSYFRMAACKLKHGLVPAAQCNTIRYDDGAVIQCS